MNKLFVCIALLLLAAAFPAKGRELIVKDSLTGTSVATNAQLSVQSAYYDHASVTAPAGRNMFEESTYALVRLSYPGTAAQQSVGVASVTFDVDYEVEINSAFESRSISGRTLELELTEDVGNDVAYFQIKGASLAEITVTAANIPAGWDDIKLELLVHNNAFSPLQKNDVPALFNQGLTTDGNLDVVWSEIDAAEEYELEWTYVSDQAKTPGDSLLPSEIEIDRNLFRNNSSRVVVKNTSYQIPMVYEEGIILYRVRAVGKSLTANHPVLAKSAWTAPDNLYGTVGEYDPAHYFIYDGHEPLLNWQANISYAEEGKHKVITNYHDGSNRQRQAVTRINTDQRAIVGEQFFDYNGRKVIDVVPAPVKENSLGYYPHLNVPENELIMMKGIYDSISVGEGCKLSAMELSTSSGASRYYSPQNDFMNGNANKGDTLLNKNLLPDAQQYPYTQTVYTPDNTGRVKAQSGVGENYHINTDHKTRYMYSTPQQEELTRLFGEQVGLKDHYKKITTIDPNGQTTVQYKNPEGKVVATAMAGDAPENVAPLPGNKTKSISTDLLAVDSVSNTINTSRTGRVMSYAFAVGSENTEYNFKYTGKAGPYTVNCISPDATNQISFDVASVVDLELSLIDECGNTVFATVDTTFSDILELPRTVQLNAGEYTIAKELLINEDSLDAYWSMYKQEEGTCVLTENTFIDSAMANLDTLGCGLSCQDCYDEITKLNQELQAFGGLAPAEEQRLRDECDRRCRNQALDCYSGLITMRGDVGPGGQYGKLRPEKVETSTPTASINNGEPELGDYDVHVNDAGEDGFSDGNPDDNRIDPTPFPLSIFNDANQLHMHKYIRDDLAHIDRPGWRYPLRIVPANSNPDAADYNETIENFQNQILNSEAVTKGIRYEETNYYKPNGEIFYVTIFDQGDGTYLPEIRQNRAGNDNAIVTVDAATGEYKVPVKYLDQLEDFQKYWSNHWGNYLVAYHPEFGYYLDCMSRNRENVDHYNLIQTTRVEAAVDSGYLDNNGVPQIIASTPAASTDLFLQNNPAAHHYLYQKYLHYETFDVDNDGIGDTLSMAQMATVLVNCPEGKGSIECTPDSCDDGKITTVEEWNVFKALYMAEKAKLTREDAMVKAVDNRYYNGCIGNADYLSNDDQYFRRSITTQQPYTVRDRVCKKISIFGLFNFKWNCHYRTYTAYHNVTTYPYLNPDQVCYQGRAGLFFDKQQRFYPELPSENGGGEPAASCREVHYDEETNDTVTVRVPCEGQDSSVAQRMDEATWDAYRYAYESCGLCPLASELETLLQQLQANELLLANDYDITCTANSNPVKLGTLIRDHIYNAIGTSSLPTLRYSGALSPGDTTFNGEITYNGIVYGEIGLEMQSPANTSLRLSDITSLCCMRVENSDSLNVHDFEIHAAVDNATHDTTLVLNGHFNYPLAPCTIPPKCALTNGATRVSYFLRTLAMEDADNLPGKANDLITGGTDRSLLGNDAVPDTLYSDAVRRLLGKHNRNLEGGYEGNMTAYEPVWSSELITAGGVSVLAGIFSYDDDQNGSTAKEELVIEIEGLTNDEISNELIEFVNLRPAPFDELRFDHCLESNCTQSYYKADALLEDITGNQYVKPVEIYAPAFMPVSCKAATPAITEN